MNVFDYDFDYISEITTDCEPEPEFESDNGQILRATEQTVHELSTATQWFRSSGTEKMEGYFPENIPNGLIVLPPLEMPIRGTIMEATTSPPDKMSSEVEMTIDKADSSTFSSDIVTLRSGFQQVISSLDDMSSVPPSLPLDMATATPSSQFSVEQQPPTTATTESSIEMTVEEAITLFPLSQTTGSTKREHMSSKDDKPLVYSSNSTNLMAHNSTILLPHNSTNSLQINSTILLPPKSIKLLPSNSISNYSGTISVTIYPKDLATGQNYFESHNVTKNNDNRATSVTTRFKAPSTVCEAGVLTLYRREETNNCQ